MYEILIYVIVIIVSYFIFAWTPGLHKQRTLILLSLAVLSLYSIWLTTFVVVYTTTLYLLIKLHINSGNKLKKPTDWLTCAFIFIVFAVFNYSNAAHIIGSTKFSGENIWGIFGAAFLSLQAWALFRTIKNQPDIGYNFDEIVLYLIFFPKFLAGPIEQPSEFIGRLRALKTFNLDDQQIRYGFIKILLGFFKKFVISSNLSIFVFGVFPFKAGDPIFLLAIHLLLFGLFMYYDFFAYTDIAQGTALLFGVKLSENFNRPLSSRNIEEFWQRWHISMVNWFRKNIFYPLLFRRVPVYLIVPIIFVSSGLWHAFNVQFLAWGLVHAMAILVYLGYKNSSFYPGRQIRDTKIYQFTSWAMMFLFFIFSWLPLRISDFSLLLSQSPGLKFDQETDVLGRILNQRFFSAGVSIIFLELAVWILLKKGRSLEDFVFTRKPLLRWIIYISSIYLTLLLGKFSSPSFVYQTF